MTSSDPLVVKSMAGQIKNLLKALAGNVQVRVVCHGKSADFIQYKHTASGAVIDALLNEGVDIVACENMLAANGLQPEELYPGIKVVPSAIADLVVKQQEGWSYIKITV